MITINCGELHATMCQCLTVSREELLSSAVSTTVSTDSPKHNTSCWKTTSGFHFNLFTTTTISTWVHKHRLLVLLTEDGGQHHVHIQHVFIYWPGPVYPPLKSSAAAIRESKPRPPRPETPVHHTPPLRGTNRDILTFMLSQLPLATVFFPSPLWTHVAAFLIMWNNKLNNKR